MPFGSVFSALIPTVSLPFVVSGLGVSFPFGLGVGFSFGLGTRFKPAFLYPTNAL